jgi:hypothetical protein
MVMLADLRDKDFDVLQTFHGFVYKSPPIDDWEDYEDWEILWRGGMEYVFAVCLAGGKLFVVCYRQEPQTGRSAMLALKEIHTALKIPFPYDVFPRWDTDEAKYKWDCVGNRLWRLEDVR